MVSPVGSTLGVNSVISVEMVSIPITSNACTPLCPPAVETDVIRIGMHVVSLGLASYPRAHHGVSVDKVGGEGPAQLIDSWVLESSADSAEEVVGKSRGPCLIWTY